jgi:hypothetical protein
METGILKTDVSTYNIRLVGSYHKTNMKKCLKIIFNIRNEHLTDGLFKNKKSRTGHSKLMFAHIKTNTLLISPWLKYFLVL